MLLRGGPGRGGGTLRLLRVRPGAAIPRHAHRGAELTLVLEGAFADETGRYGPGDLAEAEAEVSHRPVAEGPADCVCLVAAEGLPCGSAWGFDADRRRKLLIRFARERSRSGFIRRVLRRQGRGAALQESVALDGVVDRNGNAAGRCTQQEPESSSRFMFSESGSRPIQSPSTLSISSLPGREATTLPFTVTVVPSPGV